jgi:hypothetical protein
MILNSKNRNITGALNVDPDSASDNKISRLVIKKHLLSISLRLVQHFHLGRIPAGNVVTIFL